MRNLTGWSRTFVSFEIHVFFSEMLPLFRTSGIQSEKTSSIITKFLAFGIQIGGLGSL